MSINPIAVKTFYQKAKMGGARGKVKVINVGIPLRDHEHLISSLLSIHQNVETLECGPKWKTDQPPDTGIQRAMLLI